MQFRRNYAKQELIYDLLFGIDGTNKYGKILKECDLCLICNQNKYLSKDGENFTCEKNELICTKCKRVLFTLEGFKYQCKEVKNQVSNLQNISVVLNERMWKLTQIINQEKINLSNKKEVPNWCNRDLPCKYGKGGFEVSAGIKKIKNQFIENEKSELFDKLELFHDDLINLQETIMTFINVLDTYMETPWISLIKGEENNDRSHFDDNNTVVHNEEHKNLQPCLNNQDINTNENKTNITTAQRIERIRRQQEKVREQIKSLYDNTTNKSPKNLRDNNIDDYFLLNNDSSLETKKDNVPFNNYDILWSPSSSSSSSPSSPQIQDESRISRFSFYPNNIEEIGSNLSNLSDQ